MPASDTRRLVDAIQFAACQHRDQRRKDVVATPYINHPIALAHLLVTVGGIEEVEVLQAAILHDTVEDTAATFDDLERLFGPRVTSIVREMTDDGSLPKTERKRLQVERAPRLSREAALVKLADKTCNLRDVASSPPARWPLERRREYFDWARRVVDGLPTVNAPLLAAFDEAHRAKP